MAQATLNATVVLGGKVDNSFTQIGDILSSMGSIVNGVSQQLIDFGKESLNVYRGYEDSMLDAQVALATTYGRGTNALREVMNQLDAQATEWAASTIFHTSDVANAIAQAAHANWDLDMIMDGIPAAMELAQAGGIDLSTAIDYIVKSTNAMGIEFKDVGSFIDEWVYAANSSAGTVDLFGEAMLKMGKTVTFADSRQELLSMLAILHDAGASGSEAGTLLRNTMIRLVAPTKTAKETMEELGVTQEQIDEAMSETSGDTAEAIKQLQKMGFSAYDKNGNLKSFLQIFTDLALVIDKMTESEAYDILSKFFPTRTITAALALLEEMKDGVSDLYEDLAGGKAEGYAQYASETMMSGLTGAVETLKSKWERLEEVTGKVLAVDVEAATKPLGEFIDNVANLPDAQFSALVGGAEALAGLGPSLLIAGGGFRLLGTILGSTTGKIVLGAVGILTLANAIRKYNEVEFKNNFGDLALDTEPIKNYLESVTQPFKEASAEFDAYSESVRNAVEAYKDQSGQLFNALISKVITSEKLTDTDKEKFSNIGDQMFQSVLEGINTAYGRDMALFAQYSEGGESDPMFQKVMGVMEAGYTAAIAKANNLNADLREALTSAFDDDILGEDELANIRQYIEQINELLSIEAEANRYAEEQRLMRKAQTMSLDSANEVVSMISESMNGQISDIETQRDYMLAALDKSFKKGLVDEATYNEMTDYYTSSAQETIAEVTYRKDSMVIRALKQLVSGSDMGGMDAALDQYVRMATENPGKLGIKTAKEAAMRDLVTDYASMQEWSDLRSANDMIIGLMGGIETITANLKAAEEAGNDEMAGYYRDLLARHSILSADVTYYETQEAVAAHARENPDYFDAYRAREIAESSTMDMVTVQRFAERMNAGDVVLAEDYHKYFSDETRGIFTDIVSGLGQAYDLEAVFRDFAPEGAVQDRYRDEMAAWYLMYGMDEKTSEKYLWPDEAQIEAAQDVWGMNKPPQNETLLKEEPPLIESTIPTETVQTEIAEEQPKEHVESIFAPLADFGKWYIEQGAAEQWSAISDFFSPFADFGKWYIEQGAAEQLSAIVETKDQLADTSAYDEGAAAMEAAQSEAMRGAFGFLGYLLGGVFGSTAYAEEAPAPLPQEQQTPDWFLGCGNEGQQQAAPEQQTQQLGNEQVSVTFPDAMSNGASVRNSLDSLFSTPITQRVNVVSSGGTTPGRMMAEGGRADEPVVFGEDGPEWFIPEERTDRTADLLLMAAQASGFSLADLAEYSGAAMYADGGVAGGSEFALAAAAMNDIESIPVLDWGELATDSAAGDSTGGESSTPIQVQYSPVIYANDSEGVNRVLDQDKERFEEMLLEILSRRDLMESVSAYR